MSGFRLTSNAKQDLRKIGLYTKQTWGITQAKQYRKDMQLALKKLSTSPKVGRIREEIAPGLRSFKLGHHIAYYVEKEGLVIFVRLLHPSRDIKRAF